MASRETHSLDVQSPKTAPFQGGLRIPEHDNRRRRRLFKKGAEPDRGSALKERGSLKTLQQRGEQHQHSAR
jgi:hypothetical protein